MIKTRDETTKKWMEKAVQEGTLYLLAASHSFPLGLGLVQWAGVGYQRSRCGSKIQQRGEQQMYKERVGESSCLLLTLGTLIPEHQ